MIEPTVGRVVWYYPVRADYLSRKLPDPLAAIIATVWSSTCVNLSVLDANGNWHPRTSVLLVQPNEPTPEGGYCEWMPHQVGQAALNEELQEQLDAENEG